MVDIVGASFSNIADARATYRAIATTAASRAVYRDIPNAAKTSTFSTTRVTLNRTDAQTMLSVSRVSATAIVNALRQLANAAKLATDERLLANKNNLLTSSQTSISRLNINVGINAALRKIDSLISNTDFENVNLLSSTSPSFYLQTSQYGGKIAVQPQPLDRAGLGLENINLIFSPGDIQGYQALSRAYRLGLERLSTIENLHNVLVNANSLDKGLGRLITQYKNSVLPTGTFVNMQA